MLPTKELIKPLYYFYILNESAHTNITVAEFLRAVYTWFPSMVFIRCSTRLMHVRACTRLYESSGNSVLVLTPWVGLSNSNESLGITTRSSNEFNTRQSQSR